MAEILEQRLAGWLRPVSTDSQRVGAVRDGIGALSLPDPHEALDLVLLAHGHPEPDAAERLREAIAEHDAGYAGQPTDLESHIAAAAAAAHLLSGKRGVYLALAIASASFAGLKSPVDDLPTLAAELIGERAEAWRSRGDLPDPGRTTAFKELDWSDGRAINGADMQALLEAARTAHDDMTKALRKVVQAAGTRLDAADEEIDVLSWAIAGRVDGDGDDYRSIGAAGPILAGLDIYSRLRYLTPIPGTRGLLGRVLPDDQVAVAAAVDGAQGRLDSPPTQQRHRLLPVLSSLADAMDVDGDASWRVKADKHQPIDFDAAREAPEVAMQVLNELIIAAEL